ncbi:hypothetical protein BBG47_17850 [Paenibacillus sp. KS1]|uniref:HXXEE domain-containing protein n=1 Tax=Paenibacillus sp. KS1 TaxID=1849249 RepID=UPI00080646CF|nr:HXXEE domain-containing protein [Paenibacillus sp. KS1]OBY78186.1 hypothetical protein BBG47_17850 [Paenibacillus sp. KS1]
MDVLRKYWQDLGMVVAVMVCIYLLVRGTAIPDITVMLWLSFVAILVHQFEEYRWPGYFGGLFNAVLFKSKHPHNYPLNLHSAMIINLIIAYVFYLLPVLFPEVIWLGLAPMFMGFFQLIWHGIFANSKAGSLYNPGLFSVLVLHIPVGCWYVFHITTTGIVHTSDWIIGTVYFLAAVYVLIVKGNMWLKNPNSPYRFTANQLGPYSKQM